MESGYNNPERLADSIDFHVFEGMTQESLGNTTRANACYRVVEQCGEKLTGPAPAISMPETGIGAALMISAMGRLSGILATR